MTPDAHAIDQIARETTERKTWAGDLAWLKQPARALGS